MKHSRMLTAFNPYTRDPFIRFFSAPADAVTPGPDSGGQEPTGDGEQGSDQDGSESPEDEKLGEGGLKALQAEREARSQAEKQIADLNARIKEFEDAQKTDEEKQSEAELERQKQFEETAAAKAKAEAQLLRYEVAASKGIDLKFVNRINGSTKEELEADADAFLELLGNASPSSPKPDPSAGRGAEQVKPSTLQDAIGQHYS